MTYDIPEQPPPYEGPLPEGEELAQVRASIAALRTIARGTREAWYGLKGQEKVGRWATPLEIAVSEADRLPKHCTGHSRRTGLACRGTRIPGGNVCITHGGRIKQVRKKAEQRILAQLDPTMDRLMDLRDQSNHLPTALAAVKEILGRILPILPRGTAERVDDAPKGPQIVIGIMGGEQPKLQVSSTGSVPKRALPAAVLAELEEEDE